MKTPTLLLVFVLSAIIVFGSRYYTRSHYFYSSDGAQYALAMDDFSISKQQPHPPGYVFYVLAGKLIRFVIKDENLSLIIVNIILSSLSCVLIFAFTYCSSKSDKSLRAWTSWILIIPSAMFWFFGSISEIYSAELFGTLLVAYCCYRSIQNAKHYFYITPVALAFLGSIKLTAMIFLLPLALYSLLKSPQKPKVVPVLMFVITFSAWFAPMVLSEGYESYCRVTLDTFVASKSMASENGSRFRIIVRNLRDVVFYMAIAAGLLNVFFIALLKLLGLTPPRIRKDQLLFAVFWLGPYLLFLIFVYIGNIGYLIPTVAASIMFVSYYIVRTTSRKVLLLLLIISTLFSCAYFLIFSKIPAQMAGEGLEFQHKTWKQRVLSQANLFLYPLWGSIRQNDRDMEWISSEITSLCPSKGPPILIAADFSIWRKLQYYFPESLVICLYEKDRNPFLIGQKRKFVEHPQTTLELEESCKTLWFFSTPDDRVNQLKDKLLIHHPDDYVGAVYVTTGPAELSYGDVSLTINN